VINLIGLKKKLKRLLKIVNNKPTEKERLLHIVAEDVLFQRVYIFGIDVK
jgi:hypothetical protein